MDGISKCARFIVAIFVLPSVLSCFFSSLVGVIDSVKCGGTIEYLLTEFTVL